LLAACSGQSESEEAKEETIEAASSDVDPDVPELEPGRWRVVTMTESGPEFPAENVCLTEANAKNKQGLGERALELPCDQRDVTREGDVVVTRAVCSVGGVTRTIEARASGDFKSDYYVDYKENVDPPPSEGPPEIKRRLHARWMGERC
jgi:hypothetical protein